MSQALKTQIVGHDAIIAFLSSTVAKNALAHAYLIVGQQGVGKRLVIDDFLQRIVCTETIACDTCAQCIAFQKNKHPNIIKLDPRVLGDSVISVEQIRSLQQRLGLKSFDAKRQCVVIYNAEKLTTAASNALLKTLEDADSNTTILLHATHEDAVLPTLRSRCQVVRCSTVADDAIYHFLLQHGYAALQARTAASLSMGRPGLARRLLSDTQSRQFIDDAASLFLQIHGELFYQRVVTVAKKISMTDRSLAIEFLERWELLLRDVYLLSLDLREYVLHQHHVEALESLVRVYRPVFSSVFASVALAKRSLRENGNVKLIFDSLLLHLPFLAT